MVKINEIRIDQSGADNDEYFELVGTPSASLDNLTYLVIGDGSGGSGTIEAVVSLAGQTLDANGFFVAAEGTFTLGVANLTANLNFENSDNVTHLLVENFSGADGDDLDIDDDGILDVSPWTGIIDSVALIQSFNSGELTYSSTTVGSDGTFVPAHVFRNPDGAGNFAIGDFTLGVNDTPGTTNETNESLSLGTSAISFAEDGTATITVTRTGDTSNPLTVFLSSSDPSEVTVPTEVAIAAGQASATFEATGVDDGTADGDQRASIFASASGFADGTTSALTITDLGVSSGGAIAVINEVHADPDGTNGDANGDGSVDTAQDEFVEIVNVSGAPLDLSGATLSDGVGVRHVFPSGTVLADQQAIVVFGGGTPTGDFGGAIAQIASTGTLGLNNGGDTVILKDGSTDIATFTYGGEGGNNQSLTLDPDLTGVATQHASAPNSSGTLFSPGTEVDGTPFAGNENLIPIYEIQGAAHISPLVGETLKTAGIVTALESNGFYLQDRTGDGDNRTSDALFVFTSTAPTVAVGDEVVVAGTVSEFTPGGPSTGNLSTTQISTVTSVTIKSSGNSLPTATIIGSGGRIPPNQSIDDDGLTSFEPESDGIDFFESLEGMLVTAKDLVAVAGTNRFGEIFAVVDGGANATGLSARGTLNISPDDFNPERIQIDEDTDILPGFSLPEVAVGAALGDVTGVIGYDFGNFQIHPTQPFFPSSSGTVTAETTLLTGTAERVTIASYNVLNLEPNENDGDTDGADGRFTAIAAQIVNNLQMPDIIGLQEIQDNSGAADDGTTAADVTLQTLVAAIVAAGGSTYEFIDNTFITDNASGGQPGGNIRTAFLYNPNRVSLKTGSVQTIGGQSPGEPFAGARLPLVATFTFNGEEVTVINNHLSSKGGSAPILGVEQDFAARQEDLTVNGSLNERQTQAAAVKSFVEPLIANGENVVVLGDFNEFEFVSPVTTLEGAGLTNLTNTLPEDERYSYIFQGNSQSLDHILVQNNLAQTAEFDIVHVNSEFAETDSRASDHDPLIARLDLGAPPVMSKEFSRISSFIIASQIDANSNTDEETAAEIVAVSEDGNTLVYSNSPQGTLGFVNISNPSTPQGLGELDLSGEPTSVAVLGDYALVAVNTSPDFVNPSGELLIVHIATQTITRTIDIGGQPDSIAISPDGNYAVIAIENERDEDLSDGDLPQLPAGFVVVVETGDADPSNWMTSNISLTGLTGLTEPTDPEPEFVDISENNIAAVTLQENNAIVLIDLATKSVTKSFSAGTVDLDGIDTAEEDPAIIDQTSSLSSVPREPDGITFIGTDYIATADEGDWNGGSRGFTIYDLDGNIVYTSGNELDRLAAQFGHYPDSRSENKGNEPENLEFATYEGTDYLFVNSERSSLVFVYNVDDPTNPVFQQVLPAGVAPEGGKAIPGRNLLVVASEADSRDDVIRSVLNIYEYSEDGNLYPTLKSADGDPPIAWGAMSGLSPDPNNADILYGIEDSFYGSNRFFTIDTSTSPAIITTATTIKDTNDVFASISPYGEFDANDLAALINGDKTVNIDPEGIAADGNGSLWIASEGAGTVGDAGRPVESLNFLFKVNATTGVIEDVVTLPDDLNDIQVRFGFEGVAYDNGKLVTVIQRAWTGDPNPRVLVYDTNTEQWVGNYFYPLDGVESQNGGWVGLSDISPLGNGQFLVLERDNQGGPDAAVKRLYQIDLSGSLANGDTLEKTFVRNLIPDFTAAGGLMPEKLEGLAVTENGVWVINDNDGVDDNSGETQLLNLGSVEALADGTFTLELFHIADQEPLNTGAGLSDITGLSAVLNALKAQDLGDDGLADNTLILSSGDVVIPGVFYDASATVFGSAGIADIQIQNELGIQAIAFGNHEFDKGTAAIAALINGSAPGDFSALSGTALDGQDFTGTAFPYLSANLDFSTDPNMAPLEVEGRQAPKANSITASTVINVNGESIGVVGATTPTLGTISSPGGIGISPAPFNSSPTEAELDALAAEIQGEVDALLAANPGMNKVILLAHMQQLTVEQALATRLENVDIIVGGGSNTRLFDENDRVRNGDSNQGTYPQFFTNAGGTKTALVNTDGSYKYLGRLVIDFDGAGNIIPESYDSTVSGAYATDAQGVADLDAANLVDPEIQAIVDAIEEEIVASESNVFGLSSVFLNGLRSGAGDANDPDGVRTQETNLGNLTADANLAIAKEYDSSVVFSIKNGGGIRASIGEIVVPAGGSEAIRTVNGELIDGQGNIIKPEGGISQNDIAKTLAFNNNLVLLTLTKTEIIGLLEYGVAAIPGVSGRFPQIAGLKFSYDPDLEEGAQIQNAGIFDEDNNLITELVRDGEIVGDPGETFRIVTLGFLAEGGDGYPFPDLSDPEIRARVNLVDLAAAGTKTGEATFVEDGTEQDALAEYLLDNFNTPETAFSQEDTDPTGDERIQNLNFREDNVFLDDVDPNEPGNEESFEGFDPEEPGENGVIKMGNNGDTEIFLKISIKVDTLKTQTLNEIIIFKVDDEAGTVNGVSKENPDYLQAILNNEGNLFSALSLLESENNPSGLPSGLDIDGFSTLLSGLASNTRLGFMLIEDGTLHELQAGISRNVFFSNLSGFEIQNFSSLSFDLSFEGSGNTFKLEVEAIDGDNIPPGLLKQGIGLQSGREVLDLREVDDLTGQVIVYSEAAFDNLVGFYRTDESGNILSAEGDILASVGDENYINIMIEQSQTLGIEINRNTSASFVFEGGGILAPFLIANGNFGNFNVAEVFTPFLGANADGADHIRMLGNNVFGFEDLVGGGDRDFDDIIIQINFAETV